MPLFRLLHRCINAPRMLVAVIVAIWCACSWTYALIEDKGPIEGLWWGIVTGSTVGYGDFYPETTAGRFIGAVLIVSMLVLVPIAIGHVIARLVQDRNEFTHEEQVALDERTRRIEAEIARVAEVARETNLLVRGHVVRSHGPDYLHSILSIHGFPIERHERIRTRPGYVRDEA